ncbi:hypothetical protein A5N15_10470 [Rothia kristinae]|uniref:ABC transporter domain-containing protein n=1 Tax=Rothia kristinae TaxID=37923 RepID=A0A657ITN0_9MICC|nr:hypothetical protein A5N15_10470 [Rothia kristinae]
MPTSAITIHDLTFSWPDSTPCLDAADAAWGPGLHGIIGPNGSGKTTLVRLITGDLTPAVGAVSAPTPIHVMPQDLGVRAEARVAEVLGAAGTLDALEAVIAGAPTPPCTSASARTGTSRSASRAPWPAPDCPG